MAAVPGRRHLRIAPRSAKAGRIMTVTAEEFMDLIDQMRLAAFEEAMLSELPAGAIDDPGGLNVVHGPWAPDHCSTVLMCWFNLGWVALYLPGIPAERAVPPAEWESRASPGPHRMLDERHARPAAALTSRSRQSEPYVRISSYNLHTFSTEIPQPRARMALLDV